MKTMLFSLIALLAIAPQALGQSTKNPHGDISWECFDCHNTVSWNSIKPPIAFKHEKTGFPLIGQHEQVACLSCHKNLTFTHTASACVDCHTDIHRGQFGDDCQSCHSPRSWESKRDVFELHSTKGFPLVGVHSIADCNACHINQQKNEFAGTPVECHGCHESNFKTSVDPNHELAGFSTDCQSCHQPVAADWHNSTYQHPNAFALHGAHARTDCASCHATQFAGLSNLCYDCHANDFNATVNPAHQTFGFPTNCETCHDDVSWDRAQFDHLQASNFELRGAHVEIQCIACHVDNQIHDLPTNCYGCHQNEYMQTTNPSHSQGNFPQDCTQCHTENAWQPATFNHANTQFPLTGAHTAAQCIACHSSGYQNTPAECYSCHANDYNGATDPNHASNNFDHVCTQCHTTVAWEPASFDHANTQFPLTGAHTTVQCIACHGSGYQNTPVECYSCHQSDYNNVTDPNHVTNNFDHVCTQCHTTTAWQPATFDHANTQFPLTGAHLTVQCVSCHSSGYQNTPSDCFSCHASDYNGVDDPNHAQNNFSHDCTQCHSTTAWQPSTFDHNSTQFPLTGAHRTLECLSCHANGYQNTPSDCYSCHEADYNDAENHRQNNFPHDCTQCHNTSSWDDGVFNHSNTQFPLDGAHLTIQCIDCHSSGYQSLPTDCYSCHSGNYNEVVDPNHIQDNFSQICTQCHTTAAWVPASFDHTQSQFPLTGAHISQPCVSCHASGFDNTPTDCYSCHTSDYQNVSDPNHVQNNFDHLCTQCHTTNAWSPATFDHANTQFPLTGAHVALQCLSCHANGYQNTPTDCYTCHTADYQNVSDPNHVQNNFDHLCTQCHTTNAWSPATFDHANTQFPLTGAHVALQCLSCHANGYQNTPTDCYTCHTADYQNVSDPNHVQNNFDHLCTQCHSTTAWSPSTFNHNNTQFPLTGAHTSLECLACHANGYDNTPSDCYSCHESDYNGAENHRQNNFPHDCTQCHNTSSWDDGVFNHSNTQFPLDGAHLTIQCIDCHSSGYQNLPTDCYSCHSGNYNEVVDPNHIQDNFSQICTQCHTTAAWIPANFDHSQSQFPLTGAHISQPCVSCHASGFDNTPSDCYSCHTSDYQNVSDPNHVQNNFDHVCTQCHTTAAWSPASFDHNNTQFPLTGAHVALQCLSCHANGYQNTPTECYACHATDYNNANDPDHNVMGFPTVCQDCHATTAWTPSTWDHDSQYFPIFSGRHREQWNICSDCHNIPNDFRAFECINCHEHNRQDTDNDHTEVNGYQYDSDACYSCHPRGTN